MRGASSPTTGSGQAVSPATVQVMALQNQLLISKLADAEERACRLDKELEALRDQMQTLQFEKSNEYEVGWQAGTPVCKM